MEKMILNNRAIQIFLFNIGILFISSSCTPQRHSLKIIHIGDFHGELKPHANIRSGALGKEGGIARLFTKINELKNISNKQNRTSYIFMVGDTTNGAMETSFSRGNAILGILNTLEIDIFTPGNWDFSYGTCRSHEMWGFNKSALAALNTKPELNCNVSDNSANPNLRANFKSIASNVYVDNDRNAENCPKIGNRVRIFDAYKIFHDARTGLKIGVIAFTTERGPRVIGHPVVEGLCFSKGNDEVVELVTLMNEKRAIGEVDAVVMLSEMNMANNRRLVNLVDGKLGAGGIDLVLSADMHEETTKIFYTDNGTAMIAQGQHGEKIGEIDLIFEKKKLIDMHYKQYSIDKSIKEDKNIVAKVAAFRDDFRKGNAKLTHFIHGRGLPKDIANPAKPFDFQQTLAIAGQDFNRNNFSHENDAALFEGSGHRLITEGMKGMVEKILHRKISAPADTDLDRPGGASILCAQHDISGKCIKSLPVISVIRGFRYTTSIIKGEGINLEHLYHYIPIGPYTGVGVVTGAQIRGKGTFSSATSPSNNRHPNAGGIENSTYSALRPDVENWGGGWLFNWSGLTYSLNPYAAADAQVSNIMVAGQELDDKQKYIVVGYSYNRKLFGITSGVPELQFINKPFKVHFVGPSVFRVTFETDIKSTLDSSNQLDIKGAHFKSLQGAANSIPVVDLVARYLKEEFADKGLHAVSNSKGAVNILCRLPDMKKVVNTKHSPILDADYPIVDVGFSMIQPLFGANKNLIPFLSANEQKRCKKMIDLK